MKKEGKFQTTLIVMLAIAVVAMSVGFATFSTSLNINGTATFKQAKWDVHFDQTSLDITDSDATLVADTTRHTESATATTVTYDVTLKYGESYTLKINAVNAGTIDAVLTGVTLGGTLGSVNATPSAINDSETYGGNGGVTYTVKVNGDDYEDSLSGLSIPLNADDSHEVEVTLEYNPSSTTDGSDLKFQDADVTGTFTITLTYEDATVATS